MKNRLKMLRAERNWTQADLAHVLDVSRQTINAIETGRFDPSLPLAFRAARLFGLNIEAIFDDGESNKQHCASDQKGNVCLRGREVVGGYR